MVEGHWGIDKTEEIINRRYSFPNMKDAIRQYCLNCDTCQRIKVDRNKRKGLIVSLSLPEHPWQSISIDWITKLPSISRNDEDYNSILVVVDRLTKMVHLIPSNDSETSPQTAHLLLTNVFRYHGFPTSIHSDRDTKLTSDFWSELCRRLHIKHRISSAYHPQSNGQAERTVQTTKQLLRIVTLLSQQDESDLHWLDALPAVEMAINNAPIASTPYSPYFLNYGFHPCLLSDVLYPQHRPSRHINRNLLSHFTTMSDALRITSEALLRLQKQQAKQANKHRTDFTFKIGDLVLVRPHEAQRHAYGIAGTLSPHAQGPYKITAQINPTTFQIELPPGSKLHPSYHVSRLFTYRQFSPAILDVPNDTIPPDQIISDDAEVPLSTPVTNPFDPDFSEHLTGQEDSDFWRPVFQPKSGSSSDYITGQAEVDFWRPVIPPDSYHPPRHTDANLTASSTIVFHQPFSGLGRR